MKSIKFLLLFHILFQTASFGQSKPVSTYRGKEFFLLALAQLIITIFQKQGRA
jgi:hypothetical protein